MQDYLLLPTLFKDSHYRFLEYIFRIQVTPMVPYDKIPYHGVILGVDMAQDSPVAIPYSRDYRIIRKTFHLYLLIGKKRKYTCPVEKKVYPDQEKSSLNFGYQTVEGKEIIDGQAGPGCQSTAADPVS